MEERITNLQQLIFDINIVLAKEKKAKEIADKRGERFNIFETCRIASDEVRLHSRLIAEFLNPEGTHGLGGLFLKAFLWNVLGDDFDFNVNSAKVYTEKYIGPVTDQSGGQIDILIQELPKDKTKGNLIVIENKIYAEDQKNQLVRYYNYAKDNSKNFRLIYLTLDGHDPSKEALGKDSIVYHIASYRDHILRWLEDCVKETYDKPLIRETLKQYITVIKQLTNQDIGMESKEQLVDMLCRKESIEALNAITPVWHDVIKRILSEHFTPKLKTALDGSKFSIIGEENIEDCIFNSWAGISFSVSGWENCHLRIEFGISGCSDLYYGILYNNTENIRPSIDGRLRSLEGYENSTLWPLYKYFNKYRDWTTLETLKDLYSGKVVAEIRRALEELYSVANKIEGM